MRGDIADRSAVARTPDDGSFVNLGTEPQRARQRDHKPSDDSGEPEQCVDHGRLHARAARFSWACATSCRKTQRPPTPQ